MSISSPDSRYGGRRISGYGNADSEMTAHVRRRTLVDKIDPAELFKWNERNKAAREFYFYKMRNTYGDRKNSK